MNTTETSRDHADRRTAIIFGVLSFAFLLRVLGQAIQLWFPVSFLPPFEDWQGSNLPYPVLLGAQVVILIIEVWVNRRMWLSANVMPSRWIVPIVIFGILYFAVMAIRILLGLTLFPATDWFTSWISSALHLVLAAQLLLIGVYQRRKSKTQR